MADRTLSDLLRRHAANIGAGLNVALPARVLAYDHAAQKADVLPLLRRAYSDGRADDMPVITNVPVIFPRAGGASLTFPVKENDFVLLVFIDRAMDPWLASGEMATPPDLRSHNLSDAVAIPGLMPFTAQPAAENNDDVLIAYAGAKWRIKADGTIEAEAATVKVIGNLEVTGDVAVDGEVEAEGEVTGNGVALSTHTHGGVQPGGGNTGAPN